MAAAREAAVDELYDELAAADADFNTVFDSWDAFRQSSDAGSASPRRR